MRAPDAVAIRAADTLPQRFRNVTARPSWPMPCPCVACKTGTLRRETRSDRGTARNICLEVQLRTGLSSVARADRESTGDIRALNLVGFRSARCHHDLLNDPRGT